MTLNLKSQSQRTAGNELKPNIFIQWILKNIMLLVTLGGVLIGITIGFGLRPYHLGPDALLVISYPGELFMRLLKLLILPLIISSLISGSASLNTKLSGKIAVRTLLYFVFTSMFNAFLGIILATSIGPGELNLHREYETATTTRKGHNILDSLLDIGRNIFPDNIVQSTFQQAHTVYTDPAAVIQGNNTDIQVMKDVVRVISYRDGTNTLGLVFFCLVFGSILGTMGSKGQVVVDFFLAIFEVIMKMVTGVMWLTPVGIASIIAGKILGVANVALLMYQLGLFIATVSIGVFFYQLVVMQLIFYVFLKRNPFKFYWELSHATLTAFATASTAAALPVTFRCMEGPLRVDPRITRFVLPIGCNINMDGTALFLAVSSIFICQLNNLELGLAELATIFLTATAASLSSASVPSAALVLLLIVLASVDAPAHDVSLLFAVDWLMDRIRTTNNMLGDCYAAAVIEHLSKKELIMYETGYMETFSKVVATHDPEAGVAIKTTGRHSEVSDDIVIDITTGSSTAKLFQCTAK